jgi:peptidylprolyl isomerase
MASAGRRLVAAVATGLLVLAGCGSSSSSEPSVSTPSDSFHIPGTGGMAPIRYESKMHPSASGLVGEEPKLVLPTGPPPRGLVKTELIAGIGDIEGRGEKMMVQYVGYEYGTGKKFASSWDQGKPFVFKIGGGEVIPGWEKGLAELEGGDRRILVVPPSLTHGPYPPNIPPGKTVVFLVERLPDPVPDNTHGW